MNLPSKDKVPDTTRNSPQFRGGYLFGLADAAGVILSHMHHCETLEEARFGQAIVDALRKIGAAL